MGKVRLESARTSDRSCQLCARKQCQSFNHYALWKYCVSRVNYNSGYNYIK